MTTRRQFLAGAGAVAITAALPLNRAAFTCSAWVKRTGAPFEDWRRMVYPPIIVDKARFRDFTLAGVDPRHLYISEDLPAMQLSAAPPTT